MPAGRWEAEVTLSGNFPLGTAAHCGCSSWALLCGCQEVRRRCPLLRSGQEVRGLWVCGGGRKPLPHCPSVQRWSYPLGKDAVHLCWTSESSGSKSFTMSRCLCPEYLTVVSLQRYLVGWEVAIFRERQEGWESARFLAKYHPYD